MKCSPVGLIVVLACGFLMAPLTAVAQSPTKVHRIGWLHAGLSHPEPHPSLEAFRQGLRELGYTEGQNLGIEYRFAEGRDERLANLAAELVRLKVDVMVAGGVAANRAAQHATRTLPIVMAGTTDPVAPGFVASLARPEGNTTGLSLLSAELPGKRLDLLKETVPQSTRVAVLANPASIAYTLYMNNLTVAARALGLQLHAVELRSSDGLDTAFAAMTHEGADALIVMADPVLMDGLRGRVADLAAKSRLPTMYDWRMYVDAGGLMSYGPSLPVEQPTKFELIINLKAAQALRLTIPPTLLFQADEVLQ